MDISEEVIKTCAILTKGGTIIYPTDTIWGIGCDATNSKAIDKIISIKKSPPSKCMLILVDQAEKIHNYIYKMPDIAWDLITQTTRPTTFIYPKAKNLPGNLIAKDGSIAIRITTNEFCKRVIRLLGHPIVSTSANYSGKTPPILYKDIQKELMNDVDYVVNSNLCILSENKPSTIIRFIDDFSFEIVRE